MNKQEKKETIKKKFKSLSEDLRQELSFEDDYPLDNGKIADLALINTKSNQPQSLWKIEDKIEYTSKEQRTFFHQEKNPFMECGIDSKYWIYSDGEHYVLNDHAYNYPYDEHYKTLNSLFKRFRKTHE